jgi:ABC-type branched-subunit amino acid transport system permease subunit
MQVLLVIVVPAMFGFLTGIVLGASAGVYIALNLLAAIGGFLAGFDHPTRGEAALRGVIGGSLFGEFILVAHEVTGAKEEVELPHPPILLVAFTLAFGVLLGMLGATLRARIGRRRAAPPAA